MEKAGLQSRADLRLQDYRDIRDEPFDAIVSIEMFEAVGQEYWGSYFSTLHRCLKPGGRACLQTITIRDDLFERYVKSTDFIQQYIFPGGLLPSDAAFRAEARKAGLEVVRSLAFGPDYAETLRRWREAIDAQEPEPTTGPRSLQPPPIGTLLRISIVPPESDATRSALPHSSHSNGSPTCNSSRSSSISISASHSGQVAIDCSEIRNYTCRSQKQFSSRTA